MGKIVLCHRGVITSIIERLAESLLVLLDCSQVILIILVHLCVVTGIRERMAAWLTLIHAAIIMTALLHLSAIVGLLLMFVIHLSSQVLLVLL